MNFSWYPSQVYICTAGVADDRFRQRSASIVASCHHEAALLFADEEDIDRSAIMVQLPTAKCFMPKLINLNNTLDKHFRID